MATISQRIVLSIPAERYVDRTTWENLTFLSKCSHCNAETKTFSTRKFKNCTVCGRVHCLRCIRRFIVPESSASPDTFTHQYVCLGCFHHAERQLIKQFPNEDRRRPFYQEIAYQENPLMLSIIVPNRKELDSKIQQVDRRRCLSCGTKTRIHKFQCSLCVENFCADCVSMLKIWLAFHKDTKAVAVQVCNECRYEVVGGAILRAAGPRLPVSPVVKPKDREIKMTAYDIFKGGIMKQNSQATVPASRILPSVGTKPKPHNYSSSSAEKSGSDMENTPPPPPPCDYDVESRRAWNAPASPNAIDFTKMDAKLVVLTNRQYLSQFARIVEEETPTPPQHPTGTEEPNRKGSMIPPPPDDSVDLEYPLEIQDEEWEILSEPPLEILTQDSYKQPMKELRGFKEASTIFFQTLKECPEIISVDLEDVTYEFAQEDLDHLKMTIKSTSEESEVTFENEHEFKSITTEISVDSRTSGISGSSRSQSLLKSSNIAKFPERDLKAVGSSRSESLLKSSNIAKLPERDHKVVGAGRVSQLVGFIEESTREEDAELVKKRKSVERVYRPANKNNVRHDPKDKNTAAD